MNKQDIIDHLTHNCGLQRSSAISAVNGIIECISKALADGDAVIIRNLGSFSVSYCEERVYRNPNTQEAILVPAHNKVSFRASKELKELINPQSTTENNG